ARARAGARRPAEGGAGRGHTGAGRHQREPSVRPVRAGGGAHGRPGDGRSGRVAGRGKRRWCRDGPARRGGRRGGGAGAGAGGAAGGRGRAGRGGASRLLIRAAATLTGRGVDGGVVRRYYTNMRSATLRELAPWLSALNSETFANHPFSTVEQGLYE